MGGSLLDEDQLSYSWWHTTSRTWHPSYHGGAHRHSTERKSKMTVQAIQTIRAIRYIILETLEDSLMSLYYYFILIPSRCRRCRRQRVILSQKLNDNAPKPCDFVDTIVVRLPPLPPRPLHDTKLCKEKLHVLGRLHSNPLLADPIE